jgi:hypothetical protein
MRAPLALLVFAILVPVAALAQTTPEQKRLDVLAGAWRIDVDLKATPLTAATKASGTEMCEWFANRHLVCRGEAKGPAGTYSQMRTISYVPARKQYAMYTIDSQGTALVAYGQVDGDTWTFATAPPGLSIRLTLKVAAGAYTALAEYAGLDGKYLPLTEITGRRK